MNLSRSLHKSYTTAQQKKASLLYLSILLLGIHSGEIAWAREDNHWDKMKNLNSEEPIIIIKAYWQHGFLKLFFVTILTDHCSWEVFSAVSSVLTKLMNVRFSWSAHTGVSMCRSPLENVAYQFFFASLAVLSTFCLSYVVMECLPMVWETKVQSQVDSYQRLKKKWYLMPPCLSLSIIRYVSRVKWSNPRNGVAPSPTSQCSSYWKVTLD